MHLLSLKQLPVAFSRTGASAPPWSFRDRQKMKQSKLFQSRGGELRFLSGQDDGRAVLSLGESRKSLPPALLPGEKLSLALSAVLSEIAEQMWVNAALFVLFETPDSLHQVRVSLRRLGSFLLLSRILPAPPALLQKISDLERQSRTLRSALAPAREWEIFFQSILPGIKKRFSKPEEQDFLCLLSKRQKKQAGIKARKALDSRGFLEIMLGTKNLAEAFSKLEDSESMELFRGRALLLLEKTVRERSSTGESRKKAHRLRIALKTFRYVSEFFSGIESKEPPAPSFEKILASLDRLGRLNDLYSLRRRFVKLGKKDSSEKERMIIGNVIRWIRRKEKKSLYRIGKLDPLSRKE